MAQSPAERQRAYRVRLAASEGRTLGDRPGPVPNPSHGSGAAWRRHQRLGEPICAECRAWRAAYMRDRRAR